MTATVLPFNQTSHGIVVTLDGHKVEIKRRGDQVHLVSHQATLDGDMITVCLRLDIDTALKLHLATGLAAVEAKGQQIIAEAFAPRNA